MHLSLRWCCCPYARIPPGSHNMQRITNCNTLWYKNTRITTVLSLLCSLSTFQACLAATYCLNVGQNITGTTSVLVSPSQRFVLGFFSPPGSPTRSYLGIWYNQSQYPGAQTVVWVANRESPIVVGPNNNGVFRISDYGNLEVTDASGGTHWASRDKGTASANMTVKLTDSGNLVLLQNVRSNGISYIFQSFHHPTDTFLPGMKMDSEMKLTSWSSGSDPKSGIYTFTMGPTGGEYNDDPPYVIQKNLQLHWESSRKSLFGSTIAYLLSNFTTADKAPRVRPAASFENTRLVMKTNGELQFLEWDTFQGDWFVRWVAPASVCEVHDTCGHSTSCNPNNNVTCKCLPGFTAVGGGESGCVRRSEVAGAAAATYGENTTRFLTLVRVRMGIPDEKLPMENETGCRETCLQMCHKCQAYSYAAPINNDRSFSSCWIWTQDLDTLQEGYLGDDDEDGSARNLSVRVDISDIEPTPRTCEPCGTNLVPYPLSTGPNCGDPMYFNFSCNHITGQLSFIGTHTVTHMDVETRKFIIQVDPSITYCEYDRSQSDQTLQIRFPFKVTNDCLDENEVEVTWEPPPEPICSEYADCEGWKHSSCKEAGNRKRCLCDTNYHWDGISLLCTKASEGNSKFKTSLIIGITLTSVVILTCATVFAYVRKRKIARKKGKECKQRKREHYDTVRRVKNLIEVGGLEEDDNEGIEVPYFDFESMMEATDNFSDENKLGRGGYGPVYRGKLQSGEVVAIKRLSSVSSQGLQEFKNEVVLIAKLQHRNLVRLRGYCIKGDEKILIYEYMHNKSLDLFIFGPEQSVLLDWQMRFDIILGVARGMLYLRQDSRLRVIHRDLKTSNILLDEDMQPRISDFGLAKIVSSKETAANTERVVGTYGYMSPEYAMDGLFSTKSDVFSLGVVVLEIISGKKNTGFYQSDQYTSLLGYAWSLWAENKLLDLMDTSLRESCNTNQFIRCAHIGLLCVQNEPCDRPSMSKVVTLLDSETATIPTPKEPTYFGSRGQSTTTTSTKQEISGQFDGSSFQEGR